MNWISNLFQKAIINSRNKKIQKQFIFIIAIFILVIISYKLYNKELPINTGVTYIILVFILTLICYLFPVLIQPILVIWLIIGLLLGEFTSSIILGIVYYLLFSPITLTLRLVKKDKFKTNPQWFDSSKKTTNYNKLY